MKAVLPFLLGFWNEFNELEVKIEHWSLRTVVSLVQFSSFLKCCLMNTFRIPTFCNGKL